MRLIWENYDPRKNMFAKTELVGLLASEDVEARKYAMRELEITSEEDLLPFLADCLMHYYSALQSAAADVLVHMGDQRVLFHFIHALASDDMQTRYKAAEAILAFDDAPPLIRHMQRYLRRRDGEESKASIEALGELGDERAIPCLIEALDVGDDDIRAAAAKALTRFRIGRFNVFPPEMLRRSWRVRNVNPAGQDLRRIAVIDRPDGLKEEKIVSIRLEDLCDIAEAVGTMMHDLDNGKRKYLVGEIHKIHEISEKWVSDEEILGGCGHEHRCRVCREFDRL